MTTKLRLPAYFARSVRTQISELYASTAIADLAIAIVLLFEPIFLYSVLHFTVQEVLWFMGAIYALYIIFIPFGARIASRYGYYHAIAFSIPFQIIYWILLFGSENNLTLLYFAPVAFAIEKSLFWPAFHASVSRFARDEQRAREFSVLYAIVNLTMIAGPFIGGFLSERFGVRITFAVASIIYSCSFLPLFIKREVFVPKLYQFRDTLRLYKTFPLKFLGYVGFGEEMLVLTVWPIFIFVVIKDYQETGTLVTLATLAATVLALYIGKISDKYNKRELIKIGSFFYFLVWIARYLATGFWGVFAIDALSRTSKDTVFIPLSTLTYERAEATQIIPYSVFFEQSLAIGKLLACVLGIILFSLTGSFTVLFLLAALFSLLYMFI